MHKLPPATPRITHQGRLSPLAERTMRSGEARRNTQELSQRELSPLDASRRRPPSHDDSPIQPTSMRDVQVGVHRAKPQGGDGERQSSSAGDALGLDAPREPEPYGAHHGQRALPTKPMNDHDPMRARAAREHYKRQREETKEPSDRLSMDAGATQPKRRPSNGYEVKAGARRFQRKTKGGGDPRAGGRKQARGNSQNRRASNTNEKVPTGRDRWKSQKVSRQHLEDSIQTMNQQAPEVELDVIASKGGKIKRTMLRQRNPLTGSFHGLPSEGDIDSNDAEIANGGHAKRRRLRMRNPMTGSFHGMPEPEHNEEHDDLLDDEVIYPGAVAVNPGLSVTRPYSSFVVHEAGSSVLEREIEDHSRDSHRPSPGVLNDSPEVDPEIDPEIDENKQPKSRRIVLFVLVLILCVGVGLGAGLGITLQSGETSPPMDNVDFCDDVLEVFARCREEGPDAVDRLARDCPQIDEFLRLRSQGSLEFNNSLFVGNGGEIEWCSPRDLSLWFVAGNPSTDQLSRVQQYGLGVLFFSTGGDRWTSVEEWFQSHDHCFWHGVFCSPLVPMQVDGLFLSDNSLVGTLPEELGLLTGLGGCLLWS